MIICYFSLGQYHEAALVRYKALLVQQAGRGGIDGKIRKIKAALSTSQFSQSPDSVYLVEHINLLERASPILAALPSLQGKF